MLIYIYLPKYILVLVLVSRIMVLQREMDQSDDDDSFELVGSDDLHMVCTRTLFTFFFN